MGPLTLPTGMCLDKGFTLPSHRAKKVTSKLQDTRKSALLGMNSLPTYYTNLHAEVRPVNGSILGYCQKTTEL